MTRPRARLNLLGIVLLLAGLSVGGFLYWRSFQPEAEADEDALLAQDQSKAYEQAMQRNVGAVGLLMDRWTESLAQLGRPRPLAITVMVVSGAAAGGCVLAAARRR